MHVIKHFRQDTWTTKLRSSLNHLYESRVRRHGIDIEAVHWTVEPSSPDHVDGGLKGKWTDWTTQ